MDDKRVRKPLQMKVIKVNKCRCRKCNTVIESTYVHDFKWCKCGSIAVDGGKDYLKRIGYLCDMDDMSEVEYSGTECMDDELFKLK